MNYPIDHGPPHSPRPRSLRAAPPYRQPLLFSGEPRRGGPYANVATLSKNGATTVWVLVVTTAALRPSPGPPRGAPPPPPHSHPPGHEELRRVVAASRTDCSRRTFWHRSRKKNTFSPVGSGVLCRPLVAALPRRPPPRALGVARGHQRPPTKRRSLVLLGGVALGLHCGWPLEELIFAPEHPGIIVAHERRTLLPVGGGGVLCRQPLAATALTRRKLLLLLGGVARGHRPAVPRTLR